MRGGRDLREAHRGEGGVILDQLDAGLQLQRGGAEGTGAGGGGLDQRAGKAPAPLRRSDGELADVIGRQASG